MSVGEVNDIQKITGKMPPQSIEAEEAVLGALLVNPNSITRIVETLRPQHFYKPAHREIFEAVLELFNKINSKKQAAEATSMIWLWPLSQPQT